MEASGEPLQPDWRLWVSPQPRLAQDDSPAYTSQPLGLHLFATITRKEVSLPVRPHLVRLQVPPPSVYSLVPQAGVMEGPLLNMQTYPVYTVVDPKFSLKLRRCPELTPTFPQHLILSWTPLQQPQPPPPFRTAATGL